MWNRLVVCLAVLILGGCGGAHGGAAAGEPVGHAAPSGPVLQVLSPRPGDVAQGPVTVQYTVSGASSGQLRLRLTIGDPPFFTQEWPVSGPDGTATVQDDKRITGRRDLRFDLVGADGGTVGGVTVANVTIVGRR